ICRPPGIAFERGSVSRCCHRSWHRSDPARRTGQADRGSSPARSDRGLVMTGKPGKKEDEVYRRMLALYNSIPPGPDRTERFLEKPHGPRWKERAITAGPLTLEYGRQVRELEARVSRIERHLNGAPKPLDWPKTEPIKPLEPWRRGE